VLTSLSPLRPSVPSAMVNILSVTPECPFSLVVMWEVPHRKHFHATPEEADFVVKYWRSDEPETMVNVTVNITMMENETEVSSNCAVYVCTLRKSLFLNDKHHSTLSLRSLAV